MTAEAAEDDVDIALRVARALEAVNVDYFVGGSLASSLQGEPRSTAAASSPTTKSSFLVGVPFL
jgi:hypothetical protein